MITTVKVGKQGRAMIPFDVRKKLNISEGNRLVVDIQQVIMDEETPATRQESEFGN